MKALSRIKNLHFFYLELPVQQLIIEQLHFTRGERVVLLGPIGSSKFVAKLLGVVKRVCVRATSGRTLDILPGMTAQVDIRTGDRTVMDYLLKPLRKTLSESFGER